MNAEDELHTPDPPLKASVLDENTELCSESVLENKVENVKEHDAVEDEENQIKKVREMLEEEAENQKEGEWLDILGSGQLKKKIIKKGEKDTRPQRYNLCNISLEGRLLDGTVVEKQDDVTIQLGDTEVIQGVDLAIALMDTGEVAEIEVGARFGYGKLGKLPDIPPDVPLMYTLELLSSKPEPDLETLTVAERRRTGNKKRERGNWWYSRNEPTLAIQCYRRALDYLDEAEGGITVVPDGVDENKPVDEELQELLEDRLKVCNNLAAAQMKIEAYDTALTSIQNVLRCQPQNVKALFRKGKIMAAKGETAKAISLLRIANQLEPESKVIHLELSRLVTRQKRENQREKNLYRKMLGQDKSEENSPTHSKSKNMSSN